ncbi:quinone oxidoreductase-like [Actinia tenebrosa]|uniref:Quinone oxidoreductase-like n=1 Tax=Actinia tenebrosa TaxID=6105 RepID=A0A6P8J532_ACTTE|nr:quinone oxidoreductase-like [Actinia tenebrosa]
MCAAQVMRAVRVSQFGGPEVLKLMTDVLIPRVDKGQVLIKLHAAGVNPVDTYIRSGTYARKPQLPYTPGANGAGIVHSIGDGVTQFKVGDRVYTFSSLTGTYAEFTVCNENDAFKLHDELSFTQGAALGVPYFTSYRALFHRLLVRPGETVLVHGASGGAGTAACQLARAHGLVVIGTAGTPEGEEIVRKAGAHYTFNHHSPDYVDKIKEVTEGKGVDAIVEMLANVNLHKDLQLLATGGRVGVVGNRGNIGICPRDLMARESSIFGVMLMNINHEEKKETIAALNAGAEAGWLRPIIGRELSLSEVVQAHTEIIETKGAQGKMVLTI